MFLTGAFGNIGSFTLLELLKKGHDVTCFDIKIKRNKNKQKELLKNGNFKTVWGDITNAKSVNSAMNDVDCIIHIAAIIPPLTERLPELAMSVNVGGTLNLINASKKLEKTPKIILTSSISVHGPRMHEKPPRRSDDDLRPTNVYTRSKVEAESLLKESNLIWTILRLGVVPAVEGGLKSFDESFEIPLKQRIEFVHPKDVGLALANAVSAKVGNKVLLIGGGKDCQMTSREFYKKVYGCVGIKMFPDSAYRSPKSDDEWYFTDWMDTKEAQRLLQFQNLIVDDYLNDLKEKLGFLRHLAKLFSPLIHKMLLKRSPYHKMEKTNR